MLVENNLMGFPGRPLGQGYVIEEEVMEGTQVNF